jgi:hypothetical protein
VLLDPVSSILDKLAGVGTIPTPTATATPGGLLSLLSRKSSRSRLRVLLSRQIREGPTPNSGNNRPNGPEADTPTRSRCNTTRNNPTGRHGPSRGATGCHLGGTEDPRSRSKHGLSSLSNPNSGNGLSGRPTRQRRGNTGTDSATPSRSGIDDEFPFPFRVSFRPGIPTGQTLVSCLNATEDPATLSKSTRDNFTRNSTPEVSGRQRNDSPTDPIGVNQLLRLTPDHSFRVV